MEFAEVMGQVARGFEAVGAAVLVVGLVWSVALAARVWRRSGDGQEAYRILRTAFGGVLLLGLEVLVAADLIKTVAVETSLENVAVLGLIVLIRTFLSFSLEVEIEGTWPWRRALTATGVGTLGRATARARGGDGA